MTERKKGLTMREVEIGIFRPKKGDTFVIRSRQLLTDEQKEHWTRAMKSAVAEGVNILLVDGDVDLFLIENENGNITISDGKEKSSSP